MLSIATKVERIVMESSFLTEGLRRGLINLSELARQLQPQLESDLWKPVGQAAVVMALRRVAERLPEEQRSEIALTRKTGELTTRTELTEYTFRYSDSIHECHRQLLAKAEPLRGAFVTVTRGVNEVMVICSRMLTGVVEEVFAGERLLARQDNLNAVTLHLNPDTSRAPGIYHTILKQLAWDKINLVNMICTYTELTILLEQNQTGAAFAVLSKLVMH
jgi:aspartokinase